MTGPVARASVRSSAAMSSLNDVSGSGAASTLMPWLAREPMTFAQLDPSAHALWTTTTFTSFDDIATLQGGLVTFLIDFVRLLSLSVTCQRPSERLSMEPLHGWVMAKAVAWIGGRDGPTLSRVFHRRRARTGFPE